MSGRKGTTHLGSLQPLVGVLNFVGHSGQNTRCTDKNGQEVPAMLTTLEIVDLLRPHSETGTKYSVAKLLGIRTQVIDKWEFRGDAMNDQVGLKAAEILDIDADYVLACLAAERAKNSPAFATWAHICQRLTPPALRASA